MQSSTHRSFSSRSPTRSVRGGGDSLEDKIRIKICQQTVGLGGGGGGGGGGRGGLHYYESLLSPAGKEYLLRIGNALASEGSLKAKDLSAAAKELRRYVVGGGSTMPSCNESNNKILGANTNAFRHANSTASGAKDVSFSLPPPAAKNDTPSSSVVNGKGGSGGSTVLAAVSGITANHSTQALMKATDGLVKEALRLQEHKLMNTQQDLRMSSGDGNAMTLRLTENGKRGSSSIAANALLKYKGLPMSFQHHHGGMPSDGMQTGTSPIKKRALCDGSNRSHSQMSVRRAKDSASGLPPRSQTSMSVLTPSPTDKTAGSATPPALNTSAGAGGVGGGNNSSSVMMSFVNRSQDEINRALAIGSLKPHMVKRIRALNADKVVVESIQNECAAVQHERAEKAQQKIALRNATKEEMRKLEEARLAKEEQARQERALGREMTIKEIEALKALEIERIQKRKMQHEKEKEFLLQQQALRAATKAQLSSEAKSEEEMYRLMYKEERERIEREERERKQLLKEDIQEYMGECQSLIVERSRKRQEEERKQREADAAAMHLLAEREKKRFGTDGQPASRVEAGFPRINQSASSRNDTTVVAHKTSDYLLSTRDRDRTEATERKLLALREAQDLAAAKYAEATAAKETERKAQEARTALAMQEKEREKQQRHAQERQQFLNSRAALVKGLDLETRIHERRKEELQREKLRDRMVADEEARRQIEQRELEAKKKQAAKQHFIASIEEQRIARFEQILQPMSVKIGNEGDHDYSKSGFAPKRETL